MIKSTTVSFLEFDNARSEPAVTAPMLASFAECAAVERLATFKCTGDFGPTALPSIAVMLASPALSTLEIINGNQPSLFSGAHMPAVLSAFSASSLQTLELCVDLFSATTYAHGAAVIDSLVGHPTLQTLGLQDNKVAPAARLAVGAALGRVVATCTALRELVLIGCELGDIGPEPLFRALPASRLEALFSRDNGFSNDFARAVISPAVLACETLAEWDPETRAFPVLLKALRAVERRRE